MQPNQPGPELPGQPAPGQPLYQPPVGPNPYTQVLPATPPKQGINLWLIISIVLTLLLIAVSSFGVWAYLGRQDYKDNVDAKITQALAAKSQTISATKDKELAEKEKSPLKIYTGPEQYGSLSVSYPKTWSAYVSQSDTSTAVDGYFHPDVVPGTQTPGATYALRVQVVSQTYDQVTQQLTSLVKSGKISAAPFALAKQPKIIGTKFQGQIESNVQGQMVVLPLRDKTIKIYTESSLYFNDFNTYILPNFNFQP